MKMDFVTDSIPHFAGCDLDPADRTYDQRACYFGQEWISGRSKGTVMVDASSEG